MRKVLSAFCLFLMTALLSVQPAQAANPSAANIFDSIGGTTTIDRGGAIHSQARSIYSLGGGMVSFQGKKVSLLAADPPSFSAGCNGISWHFGGFAFISLDEIRQLVEAVAQASLGIAVDLAMQTLCPQCYAVMAKLRDMANMMRNAAADACKVAQNFGAMLANSGIFPSTGRASDCSKSAAESGKTSSFLDSWAGSACRLLSDAESAISTAADKTMDFLKFGTTSGATPSREQLETVGNVTYKALGALGYEDGIIKDLLLSIVGMTIIHPKPDVDCRNTFQNLYASARDVQALNPEEAVALKNLLDTPSDKRVQGSSTSSEPKVSTDVSTKTASSSTGGTTKGPTVCNAPPILAGIEEVGKAIMCGFSPEVEMARFANAYYDGDVGQARVTSLGAMCLGVANKDGADPLVYTCRTDSGECMEPKMQRMQSLAPSTAQNGYTGLAWMIGSALWDGAIAVRNNQALPSTTVRILNGSGWPLYRLINMAAVYPELAKELLDAYSAAIASQYAMDTLQKVMRIGGQPSINVQVKAGVRPESVETVRQTITNMANVGNEVKSRAMSRLAEKRQLVEIIMQINKTLQAEVIGQGLGGNTDLAVSIKRASQAIQKP